MIVTFAWINLILNEGIVSVGDNAFTSISLIGLTLPSTLTTIGDSAFSCSYGSIDYDDYAFDLIIPNSVTSIGSNAFYNCYIRTMIFNKTCSQIEAMTNYPFGIDGYYNNSIRGTDGLCTIN